jgi:hypothetical protein
MAKTRGWYYTAEGRLRYHDDEGGTEYYLTFDQVRNMQGPPPPPLTMLDQVMARQSSTDPPRVPVSFWRRLKGRH